MDERERGLEAYRGRAWSEAFEALARYDRAVGLNAGDLERLATAAYLIYRDDEASDALNRAHSAYLAVEDWTGACRCAFWMGIGLLAAGEMARANGWFSRSRRLLERETRDCAERGYLMVLAVFEQLDAGDWDAARMIASRVAEIGERFGDQNLVAFALVAQGRALIKQGRVRQGLALLDEGMLPVLADELSSPIFAGLLYCSVIDGCQEVYELRRAAEWTDALARWCAEQPEMVNFTGLCLVHRAEILQQRGEWPDALAELQRAEARLIREPFALGGARYRQAELHRLCGDFVAAEAAYAAASAAGWQPQPGLALLRLAQGRPDAAASSICRALDEIAGRLERARLLPACVEITVKVGDLARARDACGELDDLAKQYEGAVLSALAAHARATVSLADDDARGALVALRRACRVWRQVDQPYELGRSRLLVGLACRALGDDDSAGLEFDAARAAFARLGAMPDLARLDTLARRRPDDGPLTPRETQVLRLVADGRSNREVAADLVLSERTVERHVSNILTKLGVSSRAAATAYAHRHGLV
jgi:DNA-binding CsgD family transcriptional regulator